VKKVRNSFIEAVLT